MFEGGEKYDALLSEIKNLQKENNWAGIIERLNAVNEPNYCIGEDLALKLAMAYSKVVHNNVEENLSVVNKYYKLYVEYTKKLLQSDDIKNKLMIKKNLAYFYYFLYNNYPNPKRIEKNFKNKNGVKKRVEPIAFKKNEIRNKAFCLYFNIIEENPKDIPSNYRMGKLINKIVANSGLYQKSKTLNHDSELCSLFENIDEHLVAPSVLEKYKEIIKARLGEKKNFIDMHVRELGKIESIFYLKAIDEYEKLENPEEEQRYEKECIKAMFNYIRYWVDFFRGYRNDILMYYGISGISNSKDEFEEIVKNFDLLRYNKQNKIDKYIQKIYKLTGIKKKLSSEKDYNDVSMIEKNKGVAPYDFYYLIVRYYIMFILTDLSKSIEYREQIIVRIIKLLQDFIIISGMRRGNGLEGSGLNHAPALYVTFKIFYDNNLDIYGKYSEELCILESCSCYLKKEKSNFERKNRDLLNILAKISKGEKRDYKAMLSGINEKASNKLLFDIVKNTVDNLDYWENKRIEKRKIFVWRSLPSEQYLLRNK